MIRLNSTIEKVALNYMRFTIASVLLLSCFLFLYDLGHHAFNDYDEAFYAKVSDETALSGNPFTLLHGGSPWFEKPPLYFWSAMAVGSVVESKEFAYRLPSAISGIVSIVLVMLIVYSMTESYVAVCIGGLILMTSPLFLEAARQVRLDVPVTAAILFGVYSFIRGLKKERWYLGIGVGIAAAILTKSAIGIFPAVFIVVWSIVHKNLSWLKNKYFWASAALSFLILLPWHLYESMQFGGVFWNAYLFHSVFARAAGNVLAPGSGSQISQYFTVIPYAEPWLLFFCLSGFLIWSMRKRGIVIKDTLVVFLFTAAIFALFLSAGTKLSYYVTPAYPFIAIALALVGFQFYETSTAIRRYGKQILATGAVVFLASFIYTYYVGFDYMGEYHAIQEISDEERDIGQILAANPNPPQVYWYIWNWLDTMSYYSNGRAMQMMGPNQVVNNSYYLILFTAGNYAFKPAYANRLTLMHKGKWMTFYKFSY